MSEDQFKSLEDIRNYVLYLITNNNKRKIEKFLKKKKVTLKQLINLKDMDILIFSIENNASPKMIEYIVKEYNDLNYTFDFKLMGMKSPLYSALMNNNFKVADILLKNEANINYNIDKYVDILLYLDSNHLLNKANLRYLLSHNFDVVDTGAYLINNFSEDLLKIFFKYCFYDNYFILKLIRYSRNEIPVSSDKLGEMISNQNSRLNFLEDAYVRAIEKENFKVLKYLIKYDTFELFDNDQDDHYLKKTNNFERLFDIFSYYDLKYHTNKKYKFVEKLKKKQLNFNINLKKYVKSDIDNMRETVKKLIREGENDKLTAFLAMQNLDIKELNTSDFDILIYAIENMMKNSSDHNDVITTVFKYYKDNLKFSIGDDKHFKTPILSALAKNRFDIVELLFLLDNDDVFYRFNESEADIKRNMIDHMIENNMLTAKNLDYMLTSRHSFPIILRAGLISKFITNKKNDMAKVLINNMPHLINQDCYDAAIVSDDIELIESIYHKELKGPKQAILNMSNALGRTDNVEKIHYILNNTNDYEFKTEVLKFFKDYRKKYKK